MRKWFRVPKTEYASEGALMSRILLSALSILVCTVILCTATLAYFTAEVSSASNSLASAYFAVTAVDAQSAEQFEPYACALAAHDQHVFTITAGGTASTGYCIIEITDPDGITVTPYYTAQLFNGQEGKDSVTMTVTAQKGSTITFIPQWGTPQIASTFSARPTESVTLYGDQDVIVHSTTPHEICKIVEGLTLDDIAEHYRVSIESILIYNGIEKLPDVGETIKIPNTDVTDPPVVENEDEKTHIVAEGDTLESIAAQYGVTVDALCAHNGLVEEDAFTVGQTLRIPQPAADEEEPESAEDEEEPEPTIEPTPTPTPDTTTEPTPTPEHEEMTEPTPTPDHEVPAEPTSTPSPEAATEPTDVPSVIDGDEQSGESSGENTEPINVIE